MGVRRAQRTTVAIQGKPLPPGCRRLLDSDGAPILTLAPLFQITAPTAGAPLELFLFDGRGRRGAKLVALRSASSTTTTRCGTGSAASFGQLRRPRADGLRRETAVSGLSAFSAEDAALFVAANASSTRSSNRDCACSRCSRGRAVGSRQSSFVARRRDPRAVAGLARRDDAPGRVAARRLEARLSSPRSRRAGSPRARERSRRARRAAARRCRDARPACCSSSTSSRSCSPLCHDADERRLFTEALALAVRLARIRLAWW